MTILNKSVNNLSGSNPYNGQPAAFGIEGPDVCAAAGITVTWNFGDGTTKTASGLTSPTHTYTGIGTKDTVTATLSSPLFGTRILSQVITVQPASIPLSYDSYTTGHGDISSVVFQQGGVTVYSFTGTGLNTAHVPQGSYTIIVTLGDGQHYNSGTGQGYDSVSLNSNSYSPCQNWNADNSYTFAGADISNCTSLNFTVSQTACVIGGE